VVANHPDSLRATVLCAFLPLRLLRSFAAQPSFASSWKHSGFNLHAGERVPPEANADLEGLAQYILRNPFSVEKMTLESPGDMVIYRSNAGWRPATGGCKLAGYERPHQITRISTRRQKGVAH